MLNLLSNLICTALLSVPANGETTAPKALPFEVSAYVTSQNHIRVAVQKSAPESVVLLLRNKQNQIVFQETISKKELKYAAKLDVHNLEDGAYELEFKSSQGAIRKQVNLATKPVAVTAPTRMVVMNAPAE